MTTIENLLLAMPADAVLGLAVVAPITIQAAIFLGLQAFFRRRYPALDI